MPSSQGLAQVPVGLAKGPQGQGCGSASQGPPPSTAPTAPGPPLPEGSRPFCFGLRPPTQEGRPAPYCSHHPADAFLVSSGGEPVMRSLCLQRADRRMAARSAPPPPQSPAPCRAVLIFPGQTL